MKYKDKKELREYIDEWEDNLTTTATDTTLSSISNMFENMVNIDSTYFDYDLFQNPEKDSIQNDEVDDLKNNITEIRFKIDNMMDIMTSNEMIQSQSIDDKIEERINNILALMGINNMIK